MDLTLNIMAFGENYMVAKFSHANCLLLFVDKHIWLVFVCCLELVKCKLHLHTIMWYPMD